MEDCPLPAFRQLSFSLEKLGGSIPLPLHAELPPTLFPSFNSLVNICSPKVGMENMIPREKSHQVLAADGE